MKKTIVIGFIFCLLLSFATPSMALDTEFSGFYRVRGFCMHDYVTFGYNGSSIGNEHSSDYLDMLLDVTIVFKVHPRLRLVTNFTALDKVWGTTDVGPGLSEDDRNIDWNKAYMEIDTALGQFRVGRMDYGGFNHPFMDDGTEADAIQYTLKPNTWGGPRWNPLLFTFTYAKREELDWGPSLSDQDRDDYRGTLGYFSTNFIFDNEFLFIRDEAFPVGQKFDRWGYNVYGMAKFGIISIEAEWKYVHGYISEISPTEPDDLELDAMGWFIQTTLDLNQFEAYAGWAHTDGDNLLSNGGGDTLNALPGQFGDFDILFFLTSTEGLHATTLGGLGNWSADGNNPFGLDLLYIGGGFDITKDINISGVWGLANADTVPNGSKNVGWEVNFWLTWQIMDGLEYKALFAYFDAGQFWEDIHDYPYSTPIVSDDGSCWGLMHQLTLSF